MAFSDKMILQKKKARTLTYRHQERTDITRSRFLQAAEKIFARDGFEAAKLEEIAAEAGYTRGAFYSNFDTKEDLFLAMLEREITTRIETVRKHVAKYEKPAQRLGALREFWLDTCLDRRWSLLALEFKLFAVRHPEVKARLAAMHRKLVASGVEILEQVMTDVGRELPVPAYATGKALYAASSGLTLEHMLDRTAMPEDAIRKIMRSLFDALTAG